MESSFSYNPGDSHFTYFDPTFEPVFEPNFNDTQLEMRQLKFVVMTSFFYLISLPQNWGYNTVGQ